MSLTLRLTCRSLLKAPGYALVVLLTLALGVGLTTAVFAIFESVILHPLPFPASNELVATRVVLPAYAKTYPTVPVNARFYLEWSACPSFSNLALVDRHTMVLSGSGEAEKLNGAYTSPNLLDTLSVRPLLGTGLSANDDTPGAPLKILLGEALWRRRFDGDPAILGTSIVVDQKHYTVVGVLPEGFRIPSAGKIGRESAAPGSIDLLAAKRFNENERKEIFGAFNYEVIGRLAKGASLEQARAQLDVVATRLAKESGEAMEARSQVMPLQDSFVGEARNGLVLLFCSVAAVLLIACLNLAVLALSRAERQSAQYEIRAALGAGRRALFAQAIAESALLAVLGGLLGLFVASISLGTLVGLAPADLPRVDEIALRPASLAVGALLATLCGLIFGLVPSLRLAKSAASCAPGTRNASDSHASSALQDNFVGVQVALGTVLLALGLLFAQSYLSVLREDRGYQGARVESTALQIPYAKYSSDEAILAFDRRILSEAATLPGIESVALASSLPMQGETWVDSFYASDNPVKASEAPTCNVRFISGSFFEVLGVPLLEGRTFSEHDRDRKVAVLSKKMAAVLWPGQSALGKRVSRISGESAEVIGVVGDTRVAADQAPVALLYYPYWEYAMTKTQLVFRHASGARPQGALLQATLKRVDPDLPAPVLRSMDDLLTQSTAGRRFLMILCDVFAMAALVLSALGVFGVLSYRVARRRKEIGIRSALGAGPKALLLLVLGQGMKPVLVGLCVGIATAFAGLKFVAGMLYGTNGDGYLLLLSVPLLLGIVGLAACLLPALQALKIEPSEALRND